MESCKEIVRLMIASVLILPSFMRAQPVSTHSIVAFVSSVSDLPPSTSLDTKAILSQAKRKAAQEHKEIFVKFSASWCAPCHLWDAVLNDAKVLPILDRRFIFVDLDAAENADDTKHKETIGAQAYMTSLGNKGINLPFLAVLHPSGTMIFNSIMPSKGKSDGEGIGYPTTPEELDFFIRKLHQAEPTISNEDLNTIRQALVDHRGSRTAH